MGGAFWVTSEEEEAKKAEIFCQWRFLAGSNPVSSCHHKQGTKAASASLIILRISPEWNQTCSCLDLFPSVLKGGTLN